MKWLLVLVAVGLIALPHQAMAGCSYVHYPLPDGTMTTCVTCCSVNALGQPVCNTVCS